MMRAADARTASVQYVNRNQLDPMAVRIFDEAHRGRDAGADAGLADAIEAGTCTACQSALSPLRLLRQVAGSLLFGVSPHDPLRFVAHNAARRLSAGPR